MINPSPRARRGLSVIGPYPFVPDRLGGEEWAELTLTAARTVRRVMDAGQIPAVRICGAIRIPAEWARRQLRLGLDHQSAS